MKLSIIALFSDGDKHLFNKWLQNTEEKVKIEHEVIVVDNTSDGSIKSDEVKVIRGGENLGIFQGRRLGFDNSCGEYIFYVDGDDDILSLTKFEYDADLVCFNYLCRMKGEKTDCIGKDPYPVSYKATGGFYHWYWKGKCHNMVWNKFIKREVLEKIYPNIPQFELYTSEDALLSLFCLMLARSVYFDNHAFYRYYKNIGSSEGSEFANIEKAKKLFRGSKEGWTCYNLMTTPEEREASGIKTELIFINLCKYAINQTYRAKKIMPEWVEFLKEYFSESLLKSVLNEFKDEFDESALKINDFIK